MANVNSFDELNVIVGYHRSEPYEEYFDLDWLSEDEKERRIETAEKFDEHFRPLFLYLFYAALASAEIDWEYFESGLRVEYASVLEEMGYLEKTHTSRGRIPSTILPESELPFCRTWMMVNCGICPMTDCGSFRRMRAKTRMSARNSSKLSFPE